MPKVMMIRGVPMAGAYRPPMGRMLNGGLGWMPDRQVPTIRQDMRAPQPVLGWMPNERVPTLYAQMHRPNPVDIRMGALRGALRGAGLGDLCNDDGWRAVNALMTGVGSGFTQGSQETRDGVVHTDRGQAAVGSGLEATASAWRELCAQQARAQAAGDPTAADTLRRQMELERLRYQLEGNAQQASFAQQRAATAAASEKTMTYVAIGVGAVAVLGLGYFLFAGKRRRR